MFDSYTFNIMYYLIIFLLLLLLLLFKFILSDNYILINVKTFHIFTVDLWVPLFVFHMLNRLLFWSLYWAVSVCIQTNWDEHTINLCFSSESIVIIKLKAVLILVTPQNCI